MEISIAPEGDAGSLLLRSKLNSGNVCQNPPQIKKKKLNSGKIVVLNISQVLQKSAQGNHDSKTEPWTTLYYRKPKCPHQPQNKESTRLSCYHVLFQRKQWHVCWVSELQMNTHSEAQQGSVRTAGNLGWVCSVYRGCGVRSEGAFAVWAQENSKQNFAGVKDDVK